MDMNEDLAQRAIDLAAKGGAAYCDIRLVNTHRETVVCDTGRISQVSDHEDGGIGIRVLVDGAWGFASSPDLDGSSIGDTVDRATSLARQAAAVRSEPVELAPEPPHVDRWQNPVMEDPFAIPIGEKVELLLSADGIMRNDPAVVRATGMIECERSRRLFASSSGSLIRQAVTTTGAGITVRASDGTRSQLRSWPANLGGNYRTDGWEFVRSLHLEREAERIREEAVALLSAEPCPSGRKDLILMPSQLCLQIHESVGHPTELDRVMGWEADFAGTSFATTEKLGEFRYGSPIVNLVADSTLPGGLATAGYDDDGVAASRWHIVRDGVLVDYMSTRETAGLIGRERSAGCNRADGWCSTPITRIANLSLMPGDSTLAGIISSTEDGILMDTNRSWSIDHRRLNFEFACEVGWEIKDGQVGRMLRDPVYHGITPEFWNACDAIADESEFELYGVMMCGKGSPMQINRMTHGSSPARFRNVAIGSR